MNKSQIIKDLIPGALLSYEKYNILPSLTIAQAILETGWLQHIKGNIFFHAAILMTSEGFLPLGRPPKLLTIIEATGACKYIKSTNTNVLRHIKSLHNSMEAFYMKYH